MQQTKKQSLAVLCTELASVRAISDSVSKYLDLVWVRDAKTLIAAATDDNHPVLAVVVDHSSGTQNTAIDVLEAVRSAAPSVKRVLLTDHCDLGIIVAGLHTGAVQNIVYKPIHAPEFLGAVGASHLPTAINAPALRARGQAAPGIRAAG